MKYLIRLIRLLIELFDPRPVGGFLAFCAALIHLMAVLVGRL